MQPAEAQPDAAALSPADLEVVVELQKAELDRLLKENARLHERVNKLLELQEREQVLRQQMQSLLGDASAKGRLPDPQIEDDRARNAEARYRRLKQALGLLLTALERKQAL